LLKCAKTEENVAMMQEMTFGPGRLDTNPSFNMSDIERDRSLQVLSGAHHTP